MKNLKYIVKKYKRSKILQFYDPPLGQKILIPRPKCVRQQETPWLQWLFTQTFKISFILLYFVKERRAEIRYQATYQVSAALIWQLVDFVVNLIFFFVLFFSQRTIFLRISGISFPSLLRWIGTNLSIQLMDWTNEKTQRY